MTGMTDKTDMTDTLGANITWYSSKGTEPLIGIYSGPMFSSGITPMGTTWNEERSVVSGK